MAVGKIIAACKGLLEQLGITSGGVYTPPMGGSLGATDNAVLRADGTGGATAQGSLLAIDDSGNVDTTAARALTIGAANATEVTVYARKLVTEANTAGSGAPNVLTETESDKILTNEGTTVVNYHTLPSAAAGLTHTFVVQDADGLRVVANTGDTIRLGATVSAGAGYVQSTTQGATLTLVAINATEWVAIEAAPTLSAWTVDGTTATLGTLAATTLDTATATTLTIGGTATAIDLAAGSGSVYIADDVVRIEGHQIITATETAGVGAPNVLGVDESGRRIDNTGASALAYNTLPAAAAGLHFYFTVTDSDGLRVTAASGDVIRIRGLTTAAAGYVEAVAVTTIYPSPVGATLHLIARDDTTWEAVSCSGWWSDGTSSIVGEGHTPQVAFTPTWNKDNATLTGFLWREGRNLCMLVMTEMTAAPTNTGAFGWDVPLSLAADESLLLNTVTVTGVGLVYDASPSANYVGAIHYSSPGNNFSLITDAGAVSKTVPITFVATDTIRFQVTGVPVTGWKD